jgi:hypothetical protein
MCVDTLHKGDDDDDDDDINPFYHLYAGSLQLLT